MSKARNLVFAPSTPKRETVHKRKNIARTQRESRKAAEASWIVVLQNGRFEPAPLGWKGREADISRKERIKRYGLNEAGEPPCGLPKGFALALARKLQNARDRNRRRA